VPKLRFSAAARNDLESIAEYIARESASREVAESFTRDLREKCRDLARAPIRMGRPRPELRPDLRSHPVGNYVIFLRYLGDTVEIVNVIEGHRDIPAFFGDEESG
jgi:toxin ParE1/3/4